MEGVPDQSGLDAGMQLRADGQEAPLEAGQQQGQPFQFESPLQCPPQAAPYLDWFVLQRGYVAEMIRRESEVVQQQLADMHRQQLDFMLKQEHLVQNILAALNQVEQNQGICDIDRRCRCLGREVNKCYGESEVSFAVSGRDVNAHGATSSAKVTLYNESPTMPRAADGLKEDPLLVVPGDKIVCVNAERAAIGSPNLQWAERVSPMLVGLGCYQDTPNVPERSPVTQHKHLLPQEKVSMGMSQLLAGPKCTSGSDDDVEGSCEEVEKEAQAGRNIKIQALNAVKKDDAILKAFGSTPSKVEDGAPPSEAEFERIRTKLEHDPPPILLSLSARKDSRSRDIEILLELMGIKRSEIDQRPWEPGAACKCAVDVMCADGFQLSANKQLSPTDWDPGPDVAVTSVMFVCILQERQEHGKTSAKSDAVTPTFWVFSQQLGSMEQHPAISVLGHNPPPVGSASPSSTTTSPQQSTSIGSGLVPCWSSQSRRSSHWFNLYLQY